MGSRAKATLCFGWWFDIEDELPWSSNRDGDLRSWWFYVVHADRYRPTHRIHDEQGLLLPGCEFGSKTLEAYLQERKKHEESVGEPPVREAWSGVGSERGTFLYLPSSLWRAGWEEAIPVSPEALSVRDMNPDEVTNAVDFMEKFLNGSVKDTYEKTVHEIGEPQWWLGAFYG